jgi:hypothetical protein
MSIARHVLRTLKYSSQVSHILVICYKFLVSGSWLVTSEREKLVENVVERFLRDQALRREGYINKKHITQCIS